MKLQDRDNSIVALYYIYCAHPAIKNDRGYYRLKIYSETNAEQYFYYDSELKRDTDLEYINRWIQMREMGSSNESET